MIKELDIQSCNTQLYEIKSSPLTIVIYNLPHDISKWKIATVKMTTNGLTKNFKKTGQKYIITIDRINSVGEYDMIVSASGTDEEGNIMSNLILKQLKLTIID